MVKAAAGIVVFIVILLVHDHGVRMGKPGPLLRGVLFDQQGEAALLIQNATDDALHDIVLHSDRGDMEIGDIGPRQTLIDPRPAALGEIDYHFEYTYQNKRWSSRHLYRGDRPSELRLFHRFEAAGDGSFQWVTADDNYYDIQKKDHAPVVSETSDS